MGRPLNKKYFGTGTGNQLVIAAKLPGQAEGLGSIVAQKGTVRFLVEVNGVQGLAVLTDAARSALTDGQMSLEAKDAAGNIKRVVKIQGNVALFSDGTRTTWTMVAPTANPVTNEVESEDDATDFGDAADPVD